MIDCHSCDAGNRKDSKYCRVCGCLLLPECLTDLPILEMIKTDETCELSKEEKLQVSESKFNLRALLPGELLLGGEYEILKCLNEDLENNEYYAREKKVFVTCPHCNLKSSQILDYCEDCGADLADVETEDIFVRIKESADYRSFEFERDLIDQDLSNGPFSGLRNAFTENKINESELYYSVWLDDPTATALNEVDLNQPLDRLISWSLDLCEVFNLFHEKGVIYQNNLKNVVINNDCLLKISCLDHRFQNRSHQRTNPETFFNSGIEILDTKLRNSMFRFMNKYILRCVLHDMENDPDVKSIARFYWNASLTGDEDINDPSNELLGLTLLAAREEERKSPAIVSRFRISEEREFNRDVDLDINNLAFEITRLLKSTSKSGKESKLDQLLNEFLALLKKGNETIKTIASIIDKLKEILSHENIPINISLQSNALSDLGRVRELNEDSVFVMEKTVISNKNYFHCGLYVVADGMGGHDAGEIASQMAITSVKKYLCENLLDLDPINCDHENLAEIMKQSFKDANRNVFSEARNVGSNMGTTLTATLVIGNNVYFANVGDSMSCLIRDGLMHFQTKPHSYVQSLVDSGNITVNEARHHPQRNVIHRSIGTNENVDIDTYMRELLPGDLLLICSDGLTDMLPDEEILNLLIDESNITKASNKLIKMANEAGGDDNISIVLVRSDSSEKIPNKYPVFVE